jgi:pyruvate,orthophosphate dikinase
LLSRDDTGAFLPLYLKQRFLRADPFQTIDSDAVGELIRIAVERGRNTRPDLKVGICGEHAGDPRSVGFCAKAGIGYVSCSVSRLPYARLAGAQAALDDHSGPLA